MKQTKNKGIYIRLTEYQKNELNRLAKETGMSQADVLMEGLQLFKENRNDTMRLAKEYIEKTTEIIQIFQVIEEQYGELSAAEEDFLYILNFFYEILARTELIHDNPENTIPTPELMKDHNGKPEKTYIYGYTVPLPDFEKVLNSLKIKD